MGKRCRYCRPTFFVRGKYLSKTTVMMKILAVGSLVHRNKVNYFTEVKAKFCGRVSRSAQFHVKRRRAHFLAMFIWWVNIIAPPRLNLAEFTRCK
jgi:hypothetical protein